MLIAQTRVEARPAKFGQSGKMIIKAFAIPEGLCDAYLKSLLKYVDPVDNDDCWEWQGRIHNGYAIVNVPGGNSKWAHRVSYALFNGPIAENMHIDHECRNRQCTNPAHLKQMTPVENYLAIHERRLRDIRQAQEENGQLTLW